jgi:hypothetical protein
MTDFFEVKPLPAEGVQAALEAERDRQGTLTRYMLQLTTQYEATVFRGALGAVASWVEPVDRVMGRDAATPVKLAFVSGSILGMRAAEIMMGPTIIDRLAQTDLRYPMPEKKKDSDMHEILGQAYLRIHSAGEEGLKHVEALHPLLDDWDVAVTESVANAPHFKRGFGFTMYMVKQALDLDAKYEFDGFMAATGVDIDFAAIEAEFKQD